jgi:hypothetical protein
MLYKALSQAMRLETAKTAASLPARLHMLRSGAPIGTQSPGAECCRIGWPTCWHCREIGHFRRDCPTGMSKEGLSKRRLTRTQEMSMGPRKEGDTSTITPVSSLHTSLISKRVKTAQSQGWIGTKYALWPLTVGYLWQVSSPDVTVGYPRGSQVGKHNRSLKVIVQGPALWPTLIHTYKPGWSYILHIASG